MRDSIRTYIPGAQESITYGIPTFKLNGKAVCGFGAFKNHCSYFPFSGSLLADFKTELAGFAQTLSAVHFTPERQIPEELIKRMIETKLLVNAK